MVDDVASWLRSHGLSVDRVDLDGKFHRVDGAKRGRKAGWYKGWLEPIPVCVAGDWSIGENWKWRADGTVSRDVDREIKRLQREAIEAATKERAALNEKTAAKAAADMQKASAANQDHPYLASKKIKTHGIRELDGVLLVPARDTDGKLWGAQRIMRDGAKFFYKDQKVSGTFFQIGIPHGPIAYICEGFATGATINEATGAPVFCAFSAQNLKVVALALKKKIAEGIEFVIAADNDRGTPGNPGVKYGEAAAREIGARIVVPQFDRDVEGTDFNDLMMAEGIEAVTNRLQGAERPMATVTLIQGQGEKSDGKEMTQAEFFLRLAKRMNGEHDPQWPPFPHRFHVVRDDSGRKVVLEELKDQVVSFRDREVVADAIFNYCWTYLAQEPITRKLDAEKAEKARNVWARMTTPLPATPVSVRDLSDPGLTFKRFPFDTPPQFMDPAPPLFAEMLGRCSNSDALCAFIGSLFYPEADRQQYLYLYGEGGDSKGSLMRLLHDLFGSASMALNPPSKGDRFWNMNLYGKRLGLFFDCEDWEWFGSSWFKSIVGNDPIPFEPKGRGGFTDRPSCKIIAASNSKPNISSQRADLRRLIYIHFDSVKELDTAYEARLRGEAEAIVRHCKAVYLKECPKHGLIPFKSADDVALEAESKYLDIFSANFLVEPEASLSGDEVRKVLRENDVRSDQEVRRVKECWERNIKGLRIGHTRTGASYNGIRKKTATEISRGKKVTTVDDRVTTENGSRSSQNNIE